MLRERLVILLQLVGGGGGLTAPLFLGTRLVGEFELGDSVHALDNLTDRFHRTEYSVNPLT